MDLTCAYCGRLFPSTQTRMYCVWCRGVSNKWAKAEGGGYTRRSYLRRRSVAAIRAKKPDGWQDYPRYPILDSIGIGWIGRYVSCLRPGALWRLAKSNRKGK